jgi:hypothetical protein
MGSDELFRRVIRTRGKNLDSDNQVTARAVCILLTQYHANDRRLLIRATNAAETCIPKRRFAR